MKSGSTYLKTVTSLSKSLFKKVRSLKITQRHAESYRFASPSAVHITKVHSCVEDKNLEEPNCSHSGDYSAATAERYTV